MCVEPLAYREIQLTVFKFIVANIYETVQGDGLGTYIKQ